MKDVWELVKADMEARRQKGLELYGEPVTAGHDLRTVLFWLKHRYEELLDDAVYTRACIETIEAMLKEPDPCSP